MEFSDFFEEALDRIKDELTDVIEDEEYDEEWIREEAIAVMKEDIDELERDTYTVSIEFDECENEDEIRQVQNLYVMGVVDNYMSNM